MGHPPPLATMSSNLGIYWYCLIKNYSIHPFIISLTDGDTCDHYVEPLSLASIFFICMYSSSDPWHVFLVWQMTCIPRLNHDWYYSLIIYYLLQCCLTWSLLVPVTKHFHTPKEMQLQQSNSSHLLHHPVHIPAQESVEWKDKVTFSMNAIANPTNARCMSNETAKLGQGILTDWKTERDTVSR